MIEELKKYLEENPEAIDELIPEEKVAEKAKELVPDFIETEEGRKIIQPILDKTVSKGIDTWKSNHLSELIEEEVAKRNPEETPEQKQLRELKNQMSQLQKEKSIESMKSLGLQICNEKNLPSSMVNFFVADTPEQTRNNINLLEIEFKSAVEKAVEGRLKTTAHTPSQSFDSEKPIDINKMSMSEINKLAQENPELFARLTGRNI